MTSGEVESVISCLASIEAFDLAAALAETWPDQDLEKVDIGTGVSASQLSALTKRIVAHTRNAIDEDPLAFPRYYFNPDNPRIPIDLVSEVQSFASYLRNRSWHEASQRGRIITNCLVFGGHWSKTAKRVHAIYEKKAAELLSAAETKLAELNTSLVGLRAERDELQKQVKESRHELQEITEELQGAKAERQQITTILTQSSTDQGKLSALVENQTQNLRFAEKSIIENQTLQKELEESLKAAKDFYTKAHADCDWMESKRKEIDDLTSKAADGSLGGTFRIRKDELSRSVGTWRWISVFATVLAAAYVPIAFLLIPSPQVSDGLVLLANLGKIVPVVLFLGFVLRQYARERSFLEEYAFKTSVAFVVNAYADQLASARFEKTLSDFDDDKEQWSHYLEQRESERKKLIKETVDRLFTPPQIHAEKAPSLVAFRPKVAADILREAKELLAEAKR